jgi:hypothetical protein
MSRASRFRVAETSNEPSAMPIMMKGKLEVRGNMTRENEKEQKKTHVFVWMDMLLLLNLLELGQRSISRLTVETQPQL